MAKKMTLTTLPAVLLETQKLTLVDIARAVSAPAEIIVELVEYGVVEPAKGRCAQNWEFSSNILPRIRKAVRLQQDLSLDLAGLALTLDLLDEVEQLRQRVSFFEKHFNWKN